MANEIQPPTPVTNVASLVNPNTLSTLNSTTPPKAFGDQTKDQATQKIITADTHTHTHTHTSLPWDSAR